MITVYGIRACDTCKKTLKWLGAADVDHRFHDLRDDGLDADRVTAWLASDLGEKLVNRRSTTWRKLSDDERSATGERLLALLLTHPTLIKRPVICAGPEAGDPLLAIGFDPVTLAEILGITP